MPKFEKGSDEAKAHMKELRERRKNKTSNESSTEQTEPNEPIIPTKKPRKPRLKKEKIQEVVKDAIDKYFLEGTAEITLPNKIVKIENGHPKLIDTFTKSGNLATVGAHKVTKKIDGENVVSTVKGHKVIDIKPNNGENIKITNYGTKLKDQSNQFKFEMTDKKLKSITQNRNNLEEQLNELNEQLKTAKKRNERLEINKKIDELKSMKDEAEEERKAPSREWWKMTNTLNDENDKLTKINIGRKRLGKKKMTNIIL